jgi:hypothetical protein
MRIVQSTLGRRLGAQFARLFIFLDRALVRTGDDDVAWRGQSYDPYA